MKSLFFFAREGWGDREIENRAVGLCYFRRYQKFLRFSGILDKASFALKNEFIFSVLRSRKFGISFFFFYRSYILFSAKFHYKQKGKLVMQIQH